MVYLPHEGTGSVVLKRSDCDAFLSWGFAFRPQGRTPAVSRARKRERSGRCRASAPLLGSAPHWLPGGWRSGS